MWSHKNFYSCNDLYKFDHSLFFSYQTLIEMSVLEQINSYFKLFELYIHVITPLSFNKLDYR